MEVIYFGCTTVDTVDEEVIDSTRDTEVRSVGNEIDGFGCVTGEIRFTGEIRHTGEIRLETVVVEVIGFGYVTEQRTVVVRIINYVTESVADEDWKGCLSSGDVDFVESTLLLIVRQSVRCK